MISHTGIITGIVIHDFLYWDLGNHNMAICDFPSKNQPSSHLRFCLVNDLYNLPYYLKLKISVVIVMSNYSCKFGLCMSFSTVVLKH